MSVGPSHFELFIESVDVKMHWRTAVAILEESLRNRGEP